MSVCHYIALLICSRVDPSGRRNRASSWASLALGLDATCLRVFVPVVGAAVEAFFFLLIVVPSRCIWPASLPAPHAFTSGAHTFKSKRRSCHCYLPGPPAIPWLAPKLP